MVELGILKHALSMATGEKTNGLDNYLVINGRVRGIESGASELLNQTIQRNSLGAIYLRYDILYCRKLSDW